MTIQELYDALKEAVEHGHGGDPVLFDTEAQWYDCHMVSVDSARHETEPEPHMGLHEDAPHCNAKAAKAALAAEALKMCVSILRAALDSETCPNTEWRNDAARMVAAFDAWTGDTP